MAAGAGTKGRSAKRARTNQALPPQQATQGGGEGAQDSGDDLFGEGLFGDGGPGPGPGLGPGEAVDGAAWRSSSPGLVDDGLFGGLLSSSSPTPAQAGARAAAASRTEATG